MLFYLGTHNPTWLARHAVPLFVSNRTLSLRRKLPRAVGRWALDSGGFSELQLFGSWQTSAKLYAALARRYQEEVGGLDWAAVQDWMCEPFMLAKTGLSIEEHQRRTIDSYYELSALEPRIRWTPVLQGYSLADYLRHADMYQTRGISLHELPTVGLGSICRRQATEEAVRIIWALSAGRGLRLHGFGFKVKGLPKVCEHLVSSDSLAWSFTARHKPPLEGCTTHKNCANCSRYALRWRDRLLASLPQVPISEASA